MANPALALLPYTGKDGRVEITTNAGTFPVKLEKWSVKPSATKIETTNFESAQDDSRSILTLFEESVTGKVMCEVEASGTWDGNNNPHSDPPSLRAGDVVSADFYVSKTDSLSFGFPTLNILTVPVQNDVQGKVEISFTGVSSGPFTYPGDS